MFVRLLRYGGRICRKRRVLVITRMTPIAQLSGALEGSNSIGVGHLSGKSICIGTLINRICRRLRSFGSTVS